MVDYSRFDKIVVDDSTDEECEDDYMGDDGHPDEQQQQQQQASAQQPAQETQQPQGPSVTRLDGRTTITIGKDGISYGTPQGAAPATTGAAPAAPKATIVLPKAAQKGTEYTRNGSSVDGQYLWRQTKDSVTVYFVVPAETKGKDVGVTLKDTRLLVKVKGSTLAACGDGEMSHASLADAGNALGDEVDEEDVDWELLHHEDTGARLVRVTFRKANPPGTVAWWTKIYGAEAAVDVSSFIDRSTTKAAESQRVWEEAHRMFREKVQQTQKIDIDA